jgi:2-polyprenyl-6-methoxyphenol hydroxylase-like FAD-dependent oxidoreductase
MKELAALGLEPALGAIAIENAESCFFNRFGQLLYKEPRGKYAGYAHPEFGVHRGRLHLVLYEAVRDRLGADSVVTNRHCVAVEQAPDGVTVHVRETTSGAMMPPLRADIAIACDGVNSAIRKQFYPAEQVAFSGINTWRGVTRRKPILTGRSYLRIGSIRTGKIVIYPIVDDIDGDGNQLINWTTEIQRDTTDKNDWNKPGKLEDFLPLYADWTFDWLDVAALIRESDLILEYPMVDKDPVRQWTFGRVTLAGDAAHPMYPRGSNGAAQALIDGRTLADLLRQTDDPVAALRAYEDARLETTARIVQTNRQTPPDFINIKVEELTGDRPFQNLDDFITQDELRALSDQYKRIAGFARETLTPAQP